MRYRPDLIFDVGLHKGEDSDFYLKKGFRVVAAEAQADLIDYCKRRFERAIAAGRLHIVEGAIAPESAGNRIVFYKNLKNSKWGTIDPKWVQRNEKVARSIEIEVGRIDLAGMFRAHGIPFYLKIDIEGADHLVLDELQRFNDRPRYVSIEAEKIDFARLVAELETLKGLGYIAFKPVQQESIPGTTIETTTLLGERLHYSFEEASSGPFGDDLSGSWLNYNECVRRFRAIFRLYRLFGDDGLLPNMPGGMKVMGVLARLYQRPLPGWYDIHAKLG
jgi:FkbM family methyltransferase